jgi:hypothetical protein
MAYHTTAELYSLGEEILDAAAAAMYKAQGTQDSYILLQTQQYFGQPSGYMSQAQYRAYLDSVYGDVPTLFGSYGNANPASYQPMVDNMWSVACALNQKLLETPGADGGGQTDIATASWQPDPAPWWPIGQVQTYTNPEGDWQGSAAEAFSSTFVSHLDNAASVQSALALALVVMLRANGEIQMRANADAWSIGQNTIKVLDTVFATSPQDGVMELSVLAAVATVATAGLGAALGAALVGLGVTLYTGAESKTVKIGGTGLVSAFDSMHGALSTLNESIYREEQKICTNLRKLSQSVDAHLDKELTIPAPTAVTDLRGASAGKLGNPSVNNHDGFYPS